jgi:UDP-3-O-[3-hydroxymyristoyl] glucosamine N-acyltransferase
VTLYHDVTIGQRALVHSGCIIGADGFGIAPTPEGSWEKIHQLGGVTVGDDVEIGACTTIDRGALQDTIIGNGVKLDNQIQIGHNAVVGDNTVMAARAGLAGSAKVGRNCRFGGDACVVGHVTVCDGVQLTARTLVTKSISEPGSYSSGSTPLMSTSDWRKNSVRIAHLDKLVKRVGKLERAKQKIE